jgi:hypothetical protein
VPAKILHSPKLNFLIIHKAAQQSGSDIIKQSSNIPMTYKTSKYFES